MHPFLQQKAKHQSPLCEAIQATHAPCIAENCSHRVQLPTTTPKLQGNGKKYRIFQKNAGDLVSLGPWHNLGNIYSWSESSEVCYLRSSALDVCVIDKNTHSYMRAFYRKDVNPHVSRHKLIIELKRIRKKFLTGRLFHKSILYNILFQCIFTRNYY